MTVAIARLAPHQVDALAILAAEIWRQHYPSIIGTAQTEYMLAQRYDPKVICAEMERNDVWWDTLSEESELIAFASSFPAETGAIKLDKLYVHPARQRKGYGGKLIAHTCERAQRLGYGKVILAVNKHNAGAIAAYQKYGFEIVEAVVKDIGCGFVMDDYILEKRL